MKPKQSCARKLLSSCQLLCCFLCFAIPSTSSACTGSSGCPLGRYCCEDNSCKINCDSGEESNVAVIIGIIAAVVVGNVLFWVSFCCMCWCRAGKKHTFQYRLFADKQREHDVEEDDDDERTKMTYDDETATLTEEIGLSVLIPQNPNVNSDPSVPLSVTPTPILGFPKTHGECGISEKDV